MSDPYRLRTPENVAVSYDLAGVGSRFLAAVVDTVIQVAILLLIVLATTVVGGLAARLTAMQDVIDADTSGLAIWAAAIFILVNFLVLWGYYVAFELLWNGQTPGKRLWRLRVLREDGYPVGFLESLIRNLLRLVDFLPGLYGIGVLTMLLDRRSRRLGDLAAGTMVVKEQRTLRASDLLPTPPAPSGLEADLALAAVPHIDRLSAPDYSLLREYLLRRDTLGPEARGVLASELALALARRLDTPPPTDAIAADGFLLRVAAAYQAQHAGRG